LSQIRGDINAADKNTDTSGLTGADFPSRRVAQQKEAR
jgi:hypothetical protein